MAELHELTPEQRLVVETWGQGMAVLAGAGSGKTTTLVTKCVELLKLRPEARFAAVSFTERSASDLRVKLSSKLSIQGEGGALSGHWVMTIHGLCGAILRENPREAGFDGGESMLSEPEALMLWERAISALWFEDLQEPVREALDVLLARENRASLMDLLKRTRELSAFGVTNYLEAADDAAAQALAVVGRFVLERYERQKRRQGALDFNDLEKGAHRALEHERVRETYHRRFDLILVDEFQDTNPLQAGIIWRLVKPDASNLCVVGDPKQSIYRFRDADVTVFEEFCRKLPVRQALTWNFRSRPGIIEAANQICARAFEASQMEYVGLIPKREPASEGDPAARPVVRLDVRQPADLARWIRQEVGRGVPLHKMALLLRKIRGNEKWLKALTSAGIPVAVGSGGLFWEDPRVRELVSFLKWWDNPGHSLAGAIFLRAPWVGISDETLDQWVKRDPTWLAPFLESGHPLAQALKPMRERAVRPGELLQGLLLDEALESELGSAWLGLWHRVEESSLRGLDFHGVVQEISRAMDEGRRERDVPPPRNQGQLSVLTLHGSKGLEFPHVILVDLGKKARGGDMPLLFWDRERGTFLGLRDANGDRDRRNPLEAAWREREKSKNLAESKRLFYVALTRARERLILVCPELPEAQWDEEKVYDDDDWRGWIELGGRAVVESVADSGALAFPATAAVADPVPAALSTAVPASAPVLKRPRHSVTEWNLLSRCERAYEWRFVRPRVPDEGAAELGLFMGKKVPSSTDEEITQTELGSRVHSCLERGDYDALKALEAEVGADRFLAEPIISWALSSDWMAPARPPEREVWTELAFEVPLEGEVLVGSMDRLVREGGRYFILDFKVTAKAKSPETLLESYRTQLDLYARALSHLEPEARPERIEAVLLNLASRSVHSVQVPLGVTDVPTLARRASLVVQGASGRPRPGELCRTCEFLGECREGRKASQSKT